MEKEFKETGHSPLKYKLTAYPVFFSDLCCLDVIRTVLDENGGIRNFPGTAENGEWNKEYVLGPHTDVRFEAQFYALDHGETLMLWMIQPNGWYWVDDDGFGMTGDPSIVLYTVIGEDGSFLKKFELFSIDKKRYCNTYNRYL